MADDESDASVILKNPDFSSVPVVEEEEDVSIDEELFNEDVVEPTEEAKEAGTDPVTPGKDLTTPAKAKKRRRSVSYFLYILYRFI